MGLWSPVPWWYEYFQVSQELGGNPWDYIDDWTPREFWFKCGKILIAALDDHRQFKKDHPTT